MIGLVSQLSVLAPNLKARIFGLYALLIGINIGVWVWAFVAFHTYPLLWGASLLAYTFGLRHAVDADHIAAIDNVTRKLMQQGQRPIGVGFFFSLGHSTIVVGLSVAIAVTSIALQSHFIFLKDVGGLIGTSISTLFLLAIGVANALILFSLYRTFRNIKNGGAYVEEDLDLLLSKRGFFGRIFQHLFRLIEKSWHMYPLGFLFGLGFDTATEVGLLGISATEASQGLPIWSIMVFPALFTAGMVLVDTTDSILMLGAYGWAFLKPMRKLYYNMTVTFVSVVAAVLVGGIEALGLLGSRLQLQGIVWDAIGTLNDNLGTVGIVIIIFLVICWLASLVISQPNRYDEIDINSDTMT